MEPINYELRSRIGKKAGDANNLPPIESATEFLAKQIKMPPMLVEGMMHRDALVMFGGASKSFKTFALIDLALAISQGEPFWKRKTAQGRVLFINFEVGEYYFQKRVLDVATSRGLDASCPNLDIQNLRGHETDIANLAPKIIKNCREKDYSLIIVDPAYKLLGDREENSNTAITDFMHHFGKIVQATNALVLFSHHFAKGLASSKNQTDRFAGAGAFGRFVDDLITLSPHEEDLAFAVEATARDFARLEPFVVRWDYPTLNIESGLDPAKLKTRVGRREQFSVVDVLN